MGKGPLLLKVNSYENRRIGDRVPTPELVEEVAHWYWGVLAMGDTPRLLSPEEIDEALAAFAGYGQQVAEPGLGSGNALHPPSRANEKKGG